MINAIKILRTLLHATCLTTENDLIFFAFKFSCVVVCQIIVITIQMILWKHSIFGTFICEFNQDKIKMFYIMIAR